MARRHQHGLRAPAHYWPAAGTPLPRPHLRKVDAGVAAVAAHDRKLDVLAAHMWLLVGSMGLLVTVLTVVCGLLLREQGPVLQGLRPGALRHHPRSREPDAQAGVRDDPTPLRVELLSPVQLAAPRLPGGARPVPDELVNYRILFTKLSRVF